MDFSEKTEAVLAEGARQRGEYDPEPGSVPYRLYQDYVKRGGYVPIQENFCHFWRVVVFWAPMMWLRDKTVNTDGFKNFMRSTVGRFFKGLGKVIAFPFRLIGRGVRKVDSALAAKYGNDTLESIFIGLLVLFIIGAFVALIIGGTSSLGWWFGFALLGAIAVVVGISVGLEKLGEHLRAKRRAKQNAAWEAKWKAIENGTYVEPTKKEPGPVKRFFKNIADFVILFAQVVRVKKWKICPLVNIEPKA